VRISHEVDDKVVKFETLDDADVFFEDAYYYMKVKPYRGSEANAVELQNGEMCIFDEDDEVIPKPTSRMVFN
jgi:hypothetical protein